MDTYGPTVISAGLGAPPASVNLAIDPAMAAELAGIRQRESGGDYSLTPQQNYDYPRSHASGAYQFQPATWREWTQRSGIGTQYAQAYQAPKEVQDAVAAFAARHGSGVNSPALWGASAPRTAGGAAQTGDMLALMRQKDAEAERVIQEKRRAEQPIIDQLMQNWQADRKMALDRFRKMIDSNPSQVPPPKLQLPNPIQSFGSVASIFALLASAFTHMPAVNAMNGMAAAINSARKGDMEEYKIAYQRWKDQTELAIRRSELMNGEYKDAIGLLNTDRTGAEAMLQALGARFGDELTLKLLEARQIPMLAELQQKREQSTANLAKTKAEVEKLNYQLLAAQHAKEADQEYRKVVSNPSSTPEQRQDALAQRQDAERAAAIAWGHFRNAGTAEEVADYLLTHPGAKIDEAVRAVKGKTDSMSQEQAKAVNDYMQKHPEASRADAIKAVASASRPITVSQQQAQERETISKQVQKEHPGWSPAQVTAETEKQWNAVKNSGSALSTDALELAARTYLRTGQLPYLGWGASSSRVAVMNRAAEIARSNGKTVDDYIQGRAQLKADESDLRKMQLLRDSAVAYERSAENEFNLAVSKIPQTPEPLNMQVLTRWARTGEKQFGDVQVPQFMTALLSALDEYAKVLSGGTGSVAASTDAARNQALSLIPEGATTAQIPAIVNTIKQGMGFKIQSYDQQLSEIRQRISGGHPATAPAGPTPQPGSAWTGQHGIPIPAGADMSAFPHITDDPAGRAAFGKLKAGDFFIAPDGTLNQKK